MTATLAPSAPRQQLSLRQRVDAQLEELIAYFYDHVPYARHFATTQTLDLPYYIRHNIETILRIRRKRIVDALAIKYFTKHDPVRAKAWAHYTDEEMLHDQWFLEDLQALGLSKEYVYSHRPLLATQLLMGYLLYGCEYDETPLAHIASVYFVEYTTTRTQGRWLDNLARLLGPDKVAGARRHAATDVDDDHPTFVWDVLQSLARTPPDEEKVLEHIRNIYRLYEAYFVELYEHTVSGRGDQPLALAPKLPSAASGLP